MSPEASQKIITQLFSIINYWKGEASKYQLQVTQIENKLQQCEKACSYWKSQYQDAEDDLEAATEQINHDEQIKVDLMTKLTSINNLYDNLRQENISITHEIERLRMNYEPIMSNSKQTYQTDTGIQTDYIPLNRFKITRSYSFTSKIDINNIYDKNSAIRSHSYDYIEIEPQCSNIIRRMEHELRLLEFSHLSDNQENIYLLLSEIFNRLQFIRNNVYPEWEIDEEVSSCHICNRSFNVIFRKHHCRRCGVIICQNCSKTLPFYDNSRTCILCFLILSSIF